jgi:diacylglycerol O-acyltransferase
MPDVRELADAIAVAMDDLRALPRPGEPGDEEAGRPEGVVSRTTRRIAGGITGVMGKMARQVVSTAVSTVVDSAVKQVTRRPAAPKAPAAGLHSTGKRPDREPLMRSRPTASASRSTTRACPAASRCC